MTYYEIKMYRIDGSNDFLRVNLDAVPVPPDSGDWTITDDKTGGETVFTDMDDVCEIEIGPPRSLESTIDPKPWFVWDVTFNFAGSALPRTYKVIGEAAFPPEIPSSGTWWAVDGSRGDLDTCNRKCRLYMRRGNLMSITPGPSSTTCPAE